MKPGSDISFRFSSVTVVVCGILFAAAVLTTAHAQPRMSDPHTAAAAPVTVGADVLLRDSLHLVEGRRVGLICNHTAALTDGSRLLDRMQENHAIRVAAVFSPEHGFQGAASAGELIAPGSVGAIPLHSLYGRVRKPTKEMLDGIDVLVFDMQDVGSRYYTYVSTLALAIEAAAEAGIEVIVLDRPNPLGGSAVEGPVRPDSMRSFVAILPVPVRHGMTAGELARMMVAEGWIQHADRASVRVVPMTGWKRSMYYEATGLRWIPPSPNIVSIDAALAYVGMCLFEGSAVSEGRGTERPFLNIGAPFIDGEEVAEELSRYGLPGVRFTSSPFTPQANRGAASPKYQGQLCGGIHIDITDRDAFRPFETSLRMLALLNSKYGEKMSFTSYLDTLAGIHGFARRCISGSPETGLCDWSDDIARFMTRRSRYLLYP